MFQKAYLGVCKVAEESKHSIVNRQVFVGVAEGHTTPRHAADSS